MAATTITIIFVAVFGVIVGAGIAVACLTAALKYAIGRGLNL